MPTAMPDKPWERVAADLFELHGQHYLVAIDYHSRYLEITHLTNLTSCRTIKKLKAMFARWGIPDELVTDNGTQFNSGHS